MQGTPKAIEIKGIVRNATVIGAQDGQAEDLINLRFMDGSWRASGDGRLVHTMSGTQYTQLYVHTNVYHHLLGVNNGTLYWFAEIGDDGVTFYPLDGTTDRSQWPQDMQSLPTSPVALTTVVGDIWITQTGHLLTIIDENDDFEHFVFKTGDDEYIEVNIDVNGKATDRKLFPFGQVHFNCYCPCDEDHAYGGKDVDATYKYFAIDVYYETIKAVVKKKNQFAQPFIAIAAVKLYDGSYVYASNPIYIHPRERFNNLHEEGKGFVNLAGMYVTSDGTGVSKVAVVENGATFDRYLGGDVVTDGVERLNQIDNTQFPTVGPYGFISDGNPESNHGTIKFSDSYDTNGDHVEGGFINYFYWNSGYYFWVLGSDLVLSIDSDTINMIKGNEDIISSLCIFVTTEADLYKAREKDEIITVEGLDPFTRPKGTLEFNKSAIVYYKYHQGDSITINTSFTSRGSQLRDRAQIINDLKHSPFYLLREYKINELGDLLENPIVDLTDPENEGLLENLVQQNRLETEALARTTYIPKVSYMYNGRLHIANYKSYPFFGYPIDLFHLHNHSLKVQEDAWFPADANGQRVLPNLTGNNDDYLQYTKAQKTITNYDELVTAGAPYFLVKVYIDSSQGEQVVCRYIPAYNPSPAANGRADFIEDLNPLLTYPDARAKKMEIYYITDYLATSQTTGTPPNMQFLSAGVYAKWKSFDLKPHPYLNMAYYIDPDLKPIKLSDFSNWNPHFEHFTPYTPIEGGIM